MPIRDDTEIAVLCSGGVESGILLAEMSERYAGVHPLYIQTGLLWEKTELAWLRRYWRALNKLSPAGRLHPVKVLQSPVGGLYDGHWSLTGRQVPDYHSPDESVYLPGRNLILLSRAALYGAARDLDAVALGLLAGNPFPDSRPEFLSALERAVRLALGRPIRFLAPYLDASKREVLLKGRALPLHLTFSCIRPQGGRHCGDCNKCAERQRAFAAANIPDRTRYGIPKKSEPARKAARTG